ncbi:MAG: DUF1804 family protein [Gallionella sp.]
MAHDEAIRRAVRASYVFEQLSLELTAAKHGISLTAVRCWKRAGKKRGDDWSKARAAQLIIGGDIEDVARQTLSIVVQEVQATMQTIQENPDMSSPIKVDMLAKLASAYYKLIIASKRMMPETDKYAVAADVMKRYADFAHTKYPQHVHALLEVLEPFGDELIKAYG